MWCILNVYVLSFFVHCFRSMSGYVALWSIDLFILNEFMNVVAGRLVVLLITWACRCKKCSFPISIRAKNWRWIPVSIVKLQKITLNSWLLKKINLLKFFLDIGFQFSAFLQRSLEVFQISRGFWSYFSSGIYKWPGLRFHHGCQSWYEGLLLRYV